MQTLFDNFLSQKPWSGAQDFGRPIRAHLPGGLMDHEDYRASIRPVFPQHGWSTLMHEETSEAAYPSLILHTPDPRPDISCDTKSQVLRRINRVS